MANQISLVTKSEKKNPKMVPIVKLIVALLVNVRD